ncbi:uncharacterized protein LOC143374019 isoform X1 [Andrena cerasifolii]|uniref:uncharacterized protein LOC143374019 isoform X1 n=1 Tax=Andrena cerasifolii TaxID=2819439 RepID=UPI00403786A0
METSLKKDLAFAMTPLKILSWPVGTWPLQKYNVASALRTGFSVFVLLLTLTILNTETYLDGTDAEKNLDCVVLVFCTMLATWKVTQFRIRRDGLVSNFQSAVKDYNELDSPEKRAIMRRHAYMSRVTGATVFLSAYFAATIMAIVPMFAQDDEKTTLGANATKENTNMNYPVPSEYTLQVLHVPDKLFLLIFLLEYLMMLVICTGNLGSDTVFFGITFHLCGQAEILKLEFAKVVNDNKNVEWRLNALTARHLHLLKLSKQLIDTISSILILQLMCSCFFICTTGEKSLHLYYRCCLILERHDSTYKDKLHECICCVNDFPVFRVSVDPCSEFQQFRDGAKNDLGSEHIVDAIVRVQLRGKLLEESDGRNWILGLLLPVVRLAGTFIQERHFHSDEVSGPGPSESWRLLRCQSGILHEYSENFDVIPFGYARNDNHLIHACISALYIFW